MTLEINDEFPEQQVKKEAIKLGIYLGILSLVIGIVSMFVLAATTNFTVTSALLTGFTVLFSIGISAYFAIQLRKTAGGFWTFSQALKSIVIMFTISVVLSSVGTAIFNVVMPEQQQIIFDKTINFMIESLESAGASDDVIDKQVADLEKARDESREFSIGRLVKGLGVNLIVYFVFALILAAILKREKPMFLKVDNAGDAAHPWQENN
ncbi:DUF4199 domain-containing protein [Sphingobacterium oryzagri]|uniref:DUF4199 domain-containing protein n=1 Tax=Sphingobacterium oryzagri TaxID=3025669 RepID=A0ABY7WNW4_9SPHI|nr:DUF4199 domain-containing protein [Sphingobacterium sp. KACC 22765]WDF70108.1 DUF4199 domain-containing protein [Sphingobacterium sp. KACC 22765]